MTYSPPPRAEPHPQTRGLAVESVEALMRLLTPENRELLRVIRDDRPDSVAALARITHRAGPNLTRTLGKIGSSGPRDFPAERQASRPGVARANLLGPCRSVQFQ